MGDRPSFVYVVYIASTQEKVWQALTDGKISREYWGGRQVESDWQVGSPVHFRLENGELDAARLRVVEVNKPLKLVMNWTRELPGKPPPPATRVTYTLDTAGPKNVKLTVVHEEFEPGSVVDDGLRNGWPAILSSLKSYLETGEALDVTKRWSAQCR